MQYFANNADEVQKVAPNFKKTRSNKKLLDKVNPTVALSNICYSVFLRVMLQSTYQEPPRRKDFAKKRSRFPHNTRWEMSWKSCTAILVRDFETAVKRKS